MKEPSTPKVHIQTNSCESSNPVLPPTMLKNLSLKQESKQPGAKRYDTPERRKRKPSQVKDFSSREQSMNSDLDLILSGRQAQT